MHVTIDSAGRIVIPKSVRDALDLSDGTELEITLRDDGRLELEVPSTPMRLERRGERVVAVADREMPKLSQSAVRKTLERVRR
jgi:AbrB family looped-hinge helix DNA binding protein